MGISSWAALPLSCPICPPLPYTQFWETHTQKSKNWLGKSSMGKSSIGKLGKIRVVVDLEVCFYVCIELDYAILITKNQPMLLLVTDICLLRHIEKSVSPSYFKCHSAPAGLGRSAHQQGVPSAACIYLLHLYKGQYLRMLSAELFCSLSWRGETSDLSQDAEP